MKNLDKLQKQLDKPSVMMDVGDFIGEVASKRELKEVLEILIDAIKKKEAQIRSDVENARAEVRGEVLQAANELNSARKEITSLHSTISSETNRSIAELRSEVMSEVGRIFKMLPEEVDLTDLYNRTHELEMKIEGIRELQTAENIRNALETLQGDERLSMEAIAELKETLESVSKEAIKRGQTPGAIIARRLEQIIDVDMTTTPPTNGQYLSWDATNSKWVPATASGSGDMTKVIYDTDDDGVVDQAAAVEGVSGASNNTYYGKNGAGTIGFHAVTATVSALDDIGDVTVTSIASGELLKWNGSAWINNTLAEAGIAAASHTHTASEVTDFDTEVANNSAVAANTAKVGVTTQISNVVEDTTPQLGGSLDVNGNKIVSVSNGNIDIEPNGTGDVLLGNFVFDADQTVGAGQDNYVLTYDNAGGKISLEAATGGGLANVVEDTTPQLGGNLDLNGNIITASSGDAVIDNTNALGKVTMRLGTDTSGTQFDVRNNSNTALFTVAGDGTITLGTGTTGVLRADSGVVSTDSDVTDIVSAASTTTAGKVELATTAETNTGTDTGRAVTPDGLAGSNLGTKTVGIQVTDGSGAITTGDGKAYFRIPSSVNGMNLVGVAASLTAPSTSGLPNIMIARGRQAAAGTAHSFVDMLSTAITIDANEYDSKDATTAAVINTSNDDVATGDLIRIDVDGVGSGPTAVLSVNLEFRLP